MTIREEVAKRRANWDEVRGITTPFRAASIVASAESDIDQLLALVDRAMELLRHEDTRALLHAKDCRACVLIVDEARIVGTPQDAEKGTG